MKFPEEKTSFYKTYISNNPLNNGIFRDSACKSAHKTERKDESTKNIHYQKPVTFSYYRKSDLEKLLSSGCHQFFE